MTKSTLWIVPEAAEPGKPGTDDDRPDHPTVHSKRIRLALLDNSKANADHLLAIIGERIKAEFPEVEVIARRKSNAAIGAPVALLDQLALEADWAITAMAD